MSQWLHPFLSSIGGVLVLGLGAKAVGSGEEAVSRPEGPRAVVGWGRVLGEGQPAPSPPAWG